MLYFIIHYIGIIHDGARCLQHTRGPETTENIYYILYEYILYIGNASYVSATGFMGFCSPSRILSFAVN